MQALADVVSRGRSFVGNPSGGDGHSRVAASFCQPTVLVLYLAYGSYYLPRKADSVVKTSLEHDGFTVEYIALSDTVYLFTYTVSILFSGFFGDRIPSNKLLSISLLCLALCSVLKAYTTTPVTYICLQVVHAVCQSTGWPTCIKVLAVWVVENRGLVMGIWTTCQSLGGVLGALIAAWFLSKFSRKMAYLGHIPVLLIASYLCYHYVYDEHPDRPKGKAKADQRHGSERALEQQSEKTTGKISDSGAKLTLFTLCLNPNIMAVGISYFFLKFLRYALLMWLPYYYEDGLKYDTLTAGYMSTTFELGGFCGTPFIGYFSDNYMGGDIKRTTAIFMSLAAAALFFCNLVADLGVVLNSLFMFLVGVLVIGPDSQISGTIISDLVKESGYGSHAIGTVAGLINSMGSSGAIFQSGGTVFIEKTYGWASLFTTFITCALLSSAIMYLGILMHRRRSFVKLSK